jgi:hypothetical protein
MYKRERPMQSSPFPSARRVPLDSSWAGAPCFCPFAFPPGSVALSRAAGSFIPQQETRP